MLKGKEFTAIVDDIASRVSRNVNIGGETLTKAGFQNVEISVSVSVKIKDKVNGSCKMLREATYSDYDAGTGAAGSSGPAASKSLTTKGTKSGTGQW